MPIFTIQYILTICFGRRCEDFFIFQTILELRFLQEPDLFLSIVSLVN